MTTARFLVGDTRTRTAQLPDNSVDLVMTSPPFLALRSYLPADHPDKHHEIGSEPTPAAFLDTLLELTAEWGRVLAPHGSLVVELGDTYAGSGGAGGDYGPDGLRAGQPRFRQRNDGGQYGNYPQGGTKHNLDVRPISGGHGWPLDKSLTGIPTLYAWSLAYGRNLLTGQPSPAGQWRVRNLVAWVRPNPPVGALGDKFRPATSYLTVACRARDRWFDLDAVRTQPTTRPQRFLTPQRHYKGGVRQDQDFTDSPLSDQPGVRSHPAGAPPLDWWNIPPTGYAGAHYAVYPPALCERPIQAMCPRRVCTTCGQPSRRITGEPEYVKSEHYTGNGRRKPHHSGNIDDPTKATLGIDASVIRQAPTVGWSTCGCPGADGISLDGYHTGPAWRPGHVLDPFAGTGTTLVVAHGHGRASTGIDLDPRNAELAQQRLGMFLEVVHPDDKEPAA
jgi:DNA modification methylase